MSKGSKRRPGEGFDEGFDSIFGYKEPERGSWVWCSVRKKLIPKAEYVPPDTKIIYVHGDIESFVSPITREVISDRKQLRDHMREHGVTNSADYSHDFMMKRSGERIAEMTGQTPQAKAERIDLLNQELRKRGI